MKNISIWENIKTNEYDELDSDKEVDVLIVGGGITGISTLYHLDNTNLNVMLVEQKKVGFSTTGKSTGKLNYLQNDLLDKIRCNYHDRELFKYIKSQKKAIDIALNIITKEKIDCDLERTDAYLYTNKRNEVKALQKLESFLRSYGIETKQGKVNLVESKYMFKVSDTYIFNPVKFITQLSKIIKSPIYENTSIIKVNKERDYYIAYTDKYRIKAKWIVIASHYPYFTLPFLFPLKATIEKSYLSASKYKREPLSLISYSEPFISIRTYQNYLIYLANSKTISSGNSTKNDYKELIKKLNDINLVPEYLWSNCDVMSSDGLPYIGVLKDNILIGTAYNTWGLTNGILAGKILSDLVLGKKNEYCDLFDPHRLKLSFLLMGFKSAFDSLKGYIKGWMSKSEEVLYTKLDGESVAIYEDEKGKHVVRRKCPHLGCKLEFNSLEKTWDCPCHGSRFDLDGKPIEGPANKDICK